jgi:hypothetical protein
MDQAETWWECGWNNNKQIRLTTLGSGCVVWLQFQPGTFWNSLFTEFLTLQWIDWSQIWTEDVWTLYLSNTHFISPKSTECGQRNSRITEIWWAINSIRELLLLLHLNHSCNCLGSCAFLIHQDPSKMPEWNLCEWLWGPPKMAGEDPKKA